MDMLIPTGLNFNGSSRMCAVLTNYINVRSKSLLFRQCVLAYFTAYFKHCMVLSNAPFTDAKLEEVGKAIAEDTKMKILQSALQNRWPDKMSEAPKNGLAERSVQIVKRLLTKANETQSDPYLSLLEYRNSTIDNLASPAQLLTSRRLRSVLPITLNQLTPEVIDTSHVSQQLEKKQLLRKKYYDQGSRPLNELKSRNPVYMQAGNHWIPATVIRKANTPHSYIVRTTESYLPSQLSVPKDIPHTRIEVRSQHNSVHRRTQ